MRSADFLVEEKIYYHFILDKFKWVVKHQFHLNIILKLKIILENLMKKCLNNQLFK